MENNQLTHHGIVGMKWGVRRYQNKDGSLTAKGKKRYAQEMAKLKEEQRILKNKQATKDKIDKLNALREDVNRRKKETSAFRTPPKRTRQTEGYKRVEDMDLSELQAVVNRMNLESRYNQLNPEKVSLGRRIANKVLKDIVAPAATEVAKNALKDFMSDAVKKAKTKAAK